MPTASVTTASVATTLSTTTPPSLSTCFFSMSDLNHSAAQYQVDAELLHTSTERAASACLDSSKRFIWMTRGLSALALLSALGAAGLSYFQVAQIYRVWRMRNPKVVKRYQRLTMACGGLTLTALLFMVSPIGFIQAHKQRLVNAQELDGIAARVLLLEQNFAMLQVWSSARAQQQLRNNYNWEQQTNTSTPKYAVKERGDGRSNSSSSHSDISPVDAEMAANTIGCYQVVLLTPVDAKPKGEEEEQERVGTGTAASRNSGEGEEKSFTCVTSADDATLVAATKKEKERLASLILKEEPGTEKNGSTGGAHHQRSTNIEKNMQNNNNNNNNNNNRKGKEEQEKNMLPAAHAKGKHYLPHAVAPGGRLGRMFVHRVWTECSSDKELWEAYESCVGAWEEAARQVADIAKRPI